MGRHVPRRFLFKYVALYWGVQVGFIVRVCIAGSFRRHQQLKQLLNFWRNESGFLEGISIISRQNVVHEV